MKYLFTAIVMLLGSTAFSQAVPEAPYTPNTSIIFESTTWYAGGEITKLACGVRLMSEPIPNERWDLTFSTWLYDSRLRRWMPRLGGFSNEGPLYRERISFLTQLTSRTLNNPAAHRLTTVEILDQRQNPPVKTPIFSEGRIELITSDPLASTAFKERVLRLCFP